MEIKDAGRDGGGAADPEENVMNPVPVTMGAANQARPRLTKTAALFADQIRSIVVRKQQLDFPSN
jgi:hypothetical protein